MERPPRAQPASPVVVAQRLCDLLQVFPVAATSGVQWQTLVRKYEERHAARLDLGALGYSSALAAASSLLWDVLRVADREDADNPVLAIEAGVAMTPRPGYLATWPSLYEACCEVARDHGTSNASTGESSSGLLLSQLKPLLQARWHANFNECNLSYFSEEGRFVGLKKMKHLVTAILRWRAEHLERRGESGPSQNAVDAALAVRLELVQSKKHNDWILCIVPPATAAFVKHPPLAAGTVASFDLPKAHSALPAVALSVGAKKRPKEVHRALWSDVDVSEPDEYWGDLKSPSSTRSSTAKTSSLSSRSSVASGASRTSSQSGSSQSAASAAVMERELASLRAENAALRGTNVVLYHQQEAASAIFAELFHAPSHSLAAVDAPEVFDDPFEPPPEARKFSWGVGASPSNSTCSSDRAWSYAASSSGLATPVSSGLASSFPSGLASDVTSGACTPQLNFATSVQACAFVPMWLDRTRIPNGIVQQAKAFFERPGENLPNFFARH